MSAVLEHDDPFDLELFPVPTGREEAWRFTPRARVRRLLDGAPSDAHLDWTTELPDGVTLGTLTPAEARLRSVRAPVDRAAALAAANSGGAVLVTVPAGAELTEPVVLRLQGSDAQAIVWGHVLLEVGAGARATVIVEHTGSATYAGLLSVSVGDDARLDLVSLQRWDDDAVHAQSIAARLGRDSRYRSIVVTLGGQTVRVAHTVDYSAPGGDAELLGTFFTTAGQHHEHRLFVDHSAPNCRSNVLYKGALAGEKAHSVWVGDVFIRSGAVGTETYETNRNLVLTAGARADSIPNLEIETGEIVGAGHAAATGRFDDEQLFYLQSRGIPAAEARKLVVRGFFADIVQRIGVADVERALLTAIDDELTTVVSSDG